MFRYFWPTLLTERAPVGSYYSACVQPRSCLQTQRLSLPFASFCNPVQSGSPDFRFAYLPLAPMFAAGLSDCSWRWQYTLAFCKLRKLSLTCRICSTALILPSWCLESKLEQNVIRLILDRCYHSALETCGFSTISVL